MTCRNGGIGRRSGLKIRRRQKRTGSTPVFGTIIKSPVCDKQIGDFSVLCKK